MAPWTSRRGSQPATGHGDLISRIHSLALETPTALPEHLDNSASNPRLRIHAESSSSDSEYDDPRPRRPDPQRRPTHSRSMSQPFPSLFSGKKRGQEPTGGPPPQLDNVDDGGMMPARQGFEMHKRVGPSGSKDFATGNCMTCASLVRWPRELKVFKCTICMTINDLVPLTASDHQAEGAADRRRGASQGGSAPTRPTPPRDISLEHTKQLVKDCLRGYISRRLGDTPSSDHDDLHGVETRPGRASERQWQSEDSQNGSSNGLMPATYVPQYTFDELPTLRPNGSGQNSHPTRSYSSSYPSKPSFHPSLASDPSRAYRKSSHAPVEDEPKRIFKPLEDYIISCFSSFECVNSSFKSYHSRNGPKPGNESIRRKPMPTRDSRVSRQSRDTSRETSQAEAPVCEVDPKLLLLGDVAENGTWWTGGQSEIVPSKGSLNRVGDTSTLAVTPKSPHMNWEELTSWYSAIINAAENWFAVYEELSKGSGLGTITERDLQVLEQDFLVAQDHAQRVLLKASEIFLKRPGRPMENPADLRFLLIMLENPLLNPDTHQFNGLIQPDEDPMTVFNPPPRKPGTTSSGLTSGHHSGIVKRLVGLMSNSSADCHNQLIAWFARYHKTRFVRTKELVSGFLAYRMLRQNDKKQETRVDVTAGLIPELQAGRSGASLHDEIGTSSSSKKPKEGVKKIAYAEDWQIKAASRVLALLFAANNLPTVRRGEDVLPGKHETHLAAVRDGVHAHGQLLPTSDFYNSMIDYADLVADFESWESKRAKFSFCQYPFLLSIWAKTHILEYDARRQMQSKARDAFFDSIMSRRTINQYLVLDVRRECLVDDSLKAVSQVIGSGSEDVKKGLRITFRGEEGIDGGGLRKEWFLLLVREVFNPDHGMFIYDEDSQYCYFNPNSFETTDQFFLVGVVMGLAIYNSTILDVALPPFAFRKLLASAPAHGVGPSAHPRPTMKYTLDDLTEYRPRLAKGLRQLLDYDEDVEAAFSLDFVVDTEKYGTVVQVPLCSGGEQKPVTNANRREYVDLYVRYVLETAVSRQFEPFKRGFYTVCGGNAFSLFRPEEIELLVRGSDEALDIASLRAVAEYENWGTRRPEESEPLIGWFWETFQQATASEQRRLLSFITGSDRIPAMGAAMLPIKLSCLGDDSGRFPIARTCFNQLSLWRYESKERLEAMLWRAVHESEGFGLK